MNLPPVPGRLVHATDATPPRFDAAGFQRTSGKSAAHAKGRNVNVAVAAIHPYVTTLTSESRRSERMAYYVGG
jgi:hypothetical protein